MTMPDPSNLWQWTRPELQAQLTPGTVLMTDDCHCFAVTAITPEGVVSPWIGRGPQLLTWEYLEQKECTIFGHLGDDPGLSAGPVIRERGGWLDDEVTPESEDQRLDRVAVAALRRLMPPGVVKATLRAQRGEDGTGPRLLLADGTGAGIPMDGALVRAAAALFDRTAVQQHRPADGLSLALECREKRWRYDLEFEYR